MLSPPTARSTYMMLPRTSPPRSSPVSSFSRLQTPNDPTHRLPSPNPSNKSKKGPRNMKNLSLNVCPSSPISGGMTMESPTLSHQATTPAFFPPSALPKRRPSNLALNTGVMRSPSTPDLKSPIGTRGGVPMSLFRSVSATHTSDERLPYFNGPRLIAPNVWLYSEPTRQMCEGFDVVINVAREVLDPFVPTELPILSTSGSESETSDLGCVWRGKYVHIPWEHNTSTLISELPALIDLIKTSAEQGKKVLVHCQCGVSRSATLVIAYIMQEKEMSLHDAYAYVKERSPWIGPNMGLIYQLSEWGLTCRRRSLQPLPELSSSTADQEKKAFDVSLFEGLKSPTSLVAPPTLGWGNLEALPVATAPSISRSGSFPRPTLPARTRSAEAPEPFAPMVGTPMTDIYTRMERATTVENTSWPVVTAPIVETPMTDSFTRLEYGEAQTPVTTEGVIMDEPEVMIAVKDLGVIQEVEIDPRSPRAGVFSGQGEPETPMQANFMSLMEQER